jgi:WD40 repeat protein
VETFQLNEHLGGITALAVTPDGEFLISSSEDKTMKVWQLETGLCVQTLRGHSDRIKDLAIAPDGNHLISVSTDKTVKVWKAESKS